MPSFNFFSGSISQSNCQLPNDPARSQHNFKLVRNKGYIYILHFLKPSSEKDKISPMGLGICAYLLPTNESTTKISMTSDIKAENNLNCELGPATS